MVVLRSVVESWLTDWPRLFMSQITHEDGIGEQWAPFVQFVRQDDCHDLYGYMVNALWDNGKANIHIEQLPDIMTVYLSSSPDVKRKTWKLDREIVMGESIFLNDQTGSVF